MLGQQKTGKIKTGAMFALGALSVVAPNQKNADEAILPLAIGTGILQLLTIASYSQQYSNESDTKHSASTEQTWLNMLRGASEFLHQALNDSKGNHAGYQKVKVNHQG